MPARAGSGARALGVERTSPSRPRPPSAAQRRYLERGLAEPGGKLPLFTPDGREIDAKTVRSCVERGWAEPWFANPLKPDWLVCKLTAAGHDALRGGASEDG